MRLIRACLVTSLLFVACKSEKETPPAADPAPEPAKPPQQFTPPPTEPVATEPAKPEPTTPEEIETARKEAMLAGKDEDVIKYCEMAGIKGIGDGGKGDGQAQLGCALAACRVDQADKAKAWAKGLPKLLKDQANKICLANKVVL